MAGGRTETLRHVHAGGDPGFLAAALIAGAIYFPVAGPMPAKDHALPD